MKRFQQPKTPYRPTVAFAENPPHFVLGEQSKGDLERFCELLNSSEQPELREHLWKLVKAWQDSGPDLEKMLWGSHKNLLTPLQILCVGRWMPSNSGRAFMYIHSEIGRLADHVGQERVHQEKPDGSWKLTPETDAWIAFAFFTLNPHCEELAGPCARCGRYYVKKRASQKVYCSRRCGNAATAIARTHERIANERRTKIARASAAIKKWRSTATRQDWKQWVAKKTGIDPRFLTRAVTKGDIVPPKRGR
jgi:hypothetical protein